MLLTIIILYIIISNNNNNNNSLITVSSIKENIFILHFIQTGIDFASRDLFNPGILSPSGVYSSIFSTLNRNS